MEEKAQEETMIAQPEQLSGLVSELAESTWTLAAIATLFESNLADTLREPRTLDELAARHDGLTKERIRRCLDVAELRGIVHSDGSRYALAPGALPFARGPRRTDLLGEIRSTLMQAGAFVDAASQSMPARGWYHTDPRVLQAQGDSSVGFAGALAGGLAAALDGLDSRLADRGSRFLDVGVGVGALSIAMCRTFPQLSVVGIDVFDVPLALARENVACAELADRIELRQLAVEDLRDEDSFDLVWFPACFCAPSSVPPALARTRGALRPGGWLLLPTLSSEAPDDSRRIASLILEQWGNVTESGPIARQVRDAGFAEVRVIPGPGWLALVAARR
jgi:SAM-dependent methyltransferase